MSFRSELIFFPNPFQKVEGSSSFAENQIGNG
jgi:hypothetical protein